MLFPAPFSPSSAWNEPGRTRMDTSSSAVSAPKRLVIPSTSTSSARRSAARGGHQAELAQRVEQGRRRRHRAEHPALHRDHLDRREVVAQIGRAGAVLEEETLEAAVVGLAHGRVHAHVGRDAGEHEVVDAARAQDQLEIGGAERALPGLVDDHLARPRRQFGNDLPARLATHEDLAAGPGIADAGADPPRAPPFVRGQVGQIGPVAFARVDDVESAPRASPRGRPGWARSARA